MSKKKDYLFDITPRWIKYSGLPNQLNKKYGPEAWSVFHCLIQLDIRFNPDYPDTFDQKFEEIAELTGISRVTVWKYIKAFEKDGLLTVRRGKFKGQKATFKLANSIKTPKSPKEIHALDGGLLNRKGRQPILRYAEQVKDVNMLEGSNRLKIEGEQVKDRKKQVKDVNYNKKKREEKRSKGNNVKQAQAISSSPRREEEIRLLTREQVRERSQRFLKELREKSEKKKKEKLRKKLPEIKRRKKALLKQAESIIKEEQKSEPKTKRGRKGKT